VVPAACICLSDIPYRALGFKGECYGLLSGRIEAKRWRTIRCAFMLSLRPGRTSLGTVVLKLRYGSTVRHS